jgi:hypothetical protein
MIGPGSIIEVPAPITPDEVDNWQSIERVGADVATLEFNAKETNVQKISIASSLIGFVEGALSNEAINREQVSALLEKKKSILLNLAQNFEKTHKFILDTYARLMFQDSFKGSIVRYGSEFFLKSAEDMQKAYLTAKKEGASEYELDEMQKQADRKSNENNAMQLQRIEILRNLEPFIHRDSKEVQDMYSAGLATNEEARLKLNFSAYIERFERENGNIVKFAELATFQQKINRINEILESYVREDIQTSDENTEE